MKKRAKRIIVSVTNDLVTDQRVARSCYTLSEMGFNVLLVGRKLKSSLKLPTTPYKCLRMKLLFNKGPLFYAEYNIRLFLLLIVKKADILLANDLDTLLACFCVHKLKKIPLVYDAHEYFTGVPELINRPRIRAIWKKIEKMIIPKLKDIITVNNSIAVLYKEEYKVNVSVIRNVPFVKKIPENISRKKLNLPEDKKILILQGSGININRGAEEAVLAMNYIDNSILLIIGGGDVIPVLKKIVLENNLNDKVIFIPKLLPDDLMEYTCLSDIGLTLDKDTNINYRYSLPNKLFDYIHANIPILASRLPEVENVINIYNIGTFIDNHNPEHIADKIKFIFANENLIKEWKKNLIIAKSELNWENEKHIFRHIYEKFF
ncbi:MAG TPA: glycosyltransferase [Bacteroidales bacterium]|nr:glycosyltransferase [Bacteroidales bacterium]